MTTLNTIRRRIAAALLVALVALALPHAANAQPILRGKVQQAAAVAAPSIWQPVRSAFAGPGQGALPTRWAGRLSPPVVVVEAAPAPVSVPAITKLLPVAPWLNLLIP